MNQYLKLIFIAFGLGVASANADVNCEKELGPPDHCDVLSQDSELFKNCCPARFTSLGQQPAASCTSTNGNSAKSEDFADPTKAKDPVVEKSVKGN